MDSVLKGACSTVISGVTTRSDICQPVTTQTRGSYFGIVAEQMGFGYMGMKVGLGLKWTLQGVEERNVELVLGSGKGQSAYDGSVCAHARSRACMVVALGVGG